MKIITFLGIGDYEKVTYVWNNYTHTTELFPEALGIWLQKDVSEMLVLLTTEARNHRNWRNLQTRLNGKVVLRPEIIAPGKDDKELWELFEVLAKTLATGDEVALDITHAFRSIPILAFLAVAFLKTTQSVKLKHLLYGAYDARDGKNHRAPVFDLSPFLALLDGIAATEQFIKTGNAQALAELLPTTSPDIQALASSISSIAQGLHLLRPMSVMQETAQLPARITAASPTVSQSIPPFTALLVRIQEAYGRFAMADPLNYQSNAKLCLRQQLSMVQWYVEKGQTVHALSLAREWLPSLLCMHFGEEPMDNTIRQDMELLLSGGKRKDKNGNVIQESLRLAEWPNVPGGAKLRSLWGGELNLANLRNDVLHASFRKNPKDVTTIIKSTEKVIEQLQEIAMEWKL